MSNQITTNIKPSGGSVGFSFNLNSSCSGSITHWLQYAPSGSENWFTVNVDPGKSGNITISCGQNDGHNYEMTLVPEVNGVECPGIKVSQTYVSCACSSVTQVEITYNIPSGGTSSRVEIGQYVLDAN